MEVSMDMEKPVVNVTIPLRFMKKEEFGYIHTNNVCFVVSEGTCADDFKVQGYLKKTACYDRFFTQDYIKITKIGDGFTSKDFSFLFPLDISIVLYEPDEFFDSDSYKKGFFMDPFEVNSFFNESVDFVLKNSSFADLSFVKMQGLVENCFDLPDFEFYEERLSDIFVYLREKLHEHLLSVGPEVASYLQANFVESQKQREDLPESSFKEFVLKFGAVSLTVIDSFLGTRPKVLVDASLDTESLRAMPLEMLTTRLSQLIDSENFSGAAQVRDEIALRNKK